MALELRPFRSPLEPAFALRGDLEQYLENATLEAGRRDDRVPRRAGWFYLPLVLVVTVLVGRLWQLQIASADWHLAQARLNRVRSIPIPPPRGVIVDRNGQTLATSVAHYAAAIVPAELRDSPNTLLLLGRLLGMKPSEIEAILRARPNQRGFVPVPIKQNLTPELMAALEENRVRLPGVVVAPVLVRKYPHPSLAAHMLGYTGEIGPGELQRRKAAEDLAPGDVIGQLGLERKYDRALLGAKGSLLVETDARGNAIGRFGSRAERVGRSVKLTLDTRLQLEAEAALGAMGRPGAVVLMRVRDGELLALASNPTFDSNLFSAHLKPATWRALATNDRHPMLNRATGAMYPPGSTFKLITAAAALDLGLITHTSTIVCAGSIELGGREFRCTGRHGGLMLAPALAKSCNVFFMTIGRRVGAERLASYARRFGLGGRTGVDLPGEARGLVPDGDWKLRRVREAWFPGDTLNMALGQGYVLATPLQIARALSAVATGGRLPVPHFLREIRNAEGEVAQRFTAEHQSLGIADAVLAHIRRGMRQAVVEGTAQALNTDVVTVAAKTGSSQNTAGPRTHAWIAAYAPYEHPQLVCVVLMENAGHGGEAAAPVARRVLEAAFRPRADGSTVVGRASLPDSQTASDVR